jgi:hypothetical protein
MQVIQTCDANISYANAISIHRIRGLVNIRNQVEMNQLSPTGVRAVRNEDSSWKWKNYGGGDENLGSMSA